MTVVIIGGGLAGAASACILARAGARVLLLERNAAPGDKICGEFVSIEAQHILATLGLDIAALGARPINRVRIARGAAVAETTLPFQAAGLSRRVLDAALLDHARACGADVRVGVAARLAATPAGLRVHAPGLDIPRAATVFLATGKHDLRTMRRQPQRPPDDLVGFKTYFALTPQQDRALHGHVEMTLFRDGYAGLQQVDGNRANLCLLTSRDRVRQAGGHWPTLLASLLAEAPLLAQRLNQARTLLDRPVTITRVPYGFIHQASPTDPPNLFRLGDQAGVIVSFTGDGMSIALHSATLAASCVLARADAQEYHRQLRRDIAPPIQTATALHHLGHTRTGQILLMTAARTFPTLLRTAARLTRVRAGGEEASKAGALPLDPTRSDARPCATTWGALALLAFLAFALPATAAEVGPVGVWRTFDDRTGRERGLVRIVEGEGGLTGVVAGTVDPAEGARLCDLCEGGQRGRPILGLTILTGLHRDGAGWSGGRILDPETGSVYRCNLRLEEGGQVMVLRGYLGISLLGRSQTWRRAS
jgi:flavin-dependent dehydrogenase/uncharacterized protein (DUF2147 family)